MSKETTTNAYEIKVPVTLTVPIRITDSLFDELSDHLLKQEKIHPDDLRFFDGLRDHTFHHIAQQTASKVQDALKDSFPHGVSDTSVADDFFNCIGNHFNRLKVLPFLYPQTTKAVRDGMDQKIDHRK